MNESKRARLSLSVDPRRLWDSSSQLRLLLHRIVLPAFAVVALTMGCVGPKHPIETPQRPDVAPSEQPVSAMPLHLDPDPIKPMYTELLAIDLPTVVRVALADNFDIRHARQAVHATQGRYEATVGAAFPAIVPTALFEHVEGSVRATQGNLVGVGFDTFQPSVAIQWVINPGRVIYDILAARKRLLASEQQEKAVIQGILRRGAVQYYDLVLAQAGISAAHQGVLEAEELLRISQLRIATGTGVPADEMRADARLAERRQDLISGMKELYDASVMLAVTLHLDPSVTLIPSVTLLPPTQLVRNDLGIDELLGIAVAFRPDLESVRALVEAATAQQDSTWWSGFGPTLALSYQYGGITGHASNFAASPGVSFSGNSVGSGRILDVIAKQPLRTAIHRPDQTFSFSDQQRATAVASWRLALSVFGELKTAKAVQTQAVIQAGRALDEVRAQVVSAAQASQANRQLIGLAHRQVTSAEEALRLTEVHLKAGTMTTVDVLQAQDAATQARLRYAKAVVRYNQSQVDLLAALGLLDATTLLAPESGGDDQTTASTIEEQDAARSAAGGG